MSFGRENPNSLASFRRDTGGAIGVAVSTGGGRAKGSGVVRAGINGLCDLLCTLLPLVLTGSLSGLLGGVLKGETRSSAEFFSDLGTNDPPSS